MFHCIFCQVKRSSTLKHFTDCSALSIINLDVFLLCHIYLFISIAQFYFISEALNPKIEGSLRPISARSGINTSDDQKNLKNNKNQKQSNKKTDRKTGSKSPKKQKSYLFYCVQTFYNVINIEFHFRFNSSRYTQRRTI